MYTIMIEAGFSAVHSVLLPDGTPESPHAHDWGVRVCIARSRLDKSGMVMDFHKAQEALQLVLAGLQNADLNESDSMNGLNPTAEVVAGHIFEQLKTRGLVGVCKVEVTEAPGCTAIFEPPSSIDHTE